MTPELALLLLIAVMLWRIEVALSRAAHSLARIAANVEGWRERFEADSRRERRESNERT